MRDKLNFGTIVQLDENREFGVEILFLFRTYASTSELDFPHFPLVVFSLIELTNYHPTNRIRGTFDFSVYYISARIPIIFPPKLKRPSIYGTAIGI